MIGKLLDRITVVDGQGEELDVGELTTYLNDALLIAPSMLLGSAASWTAVDDGSFDVTLTDAGRAVTGRVFVDEHGAPYDFSSTDRFADLPGGMVRAEWRTPVQCWELVDGRRLHGPFGAVWQLSDGPLPYVEGAWCGQRRLQCGARSGTEPTQPLTTTTAMMAVSIPTLQTSHGWK